MEKGREILQKALKSSALKFGRLELERDELGKQKRELFDEIQENASPTLADQALRSAELHKIKKELAVSKNDLQETEKDLVAAQKRIEDLESILAYEKDKALDVARLIAELEAELGESRAARAREIVLAASAKSESSKLCAEAKAALGSSRA